MWWEGARLVHVLDCIVEGDWWVGVRANSLSEQWSLCVCVCVCVCVRVCVCECVCVCVCVCV